MARRAGFVPRHPGWLGNDAGGDRPGQIQGELDGPRGRGRRWRAAWPGLRPSASIDQVPMADGGEGTSQALVAATGGSYPRGHGDRPAGRAGRRPLRPARRRSNRRDRDGRGLGAGARARRSKRNPLIATTRGTGELLLAAIAAGATSRDRRHRRQRDQRRRRRPGPGARLSPARRRRPRPRTRRRQPGPTGPHRSPPAADAELDGVEVAVACDVTNPLCGPRGASAVYGPQKGATPAMVEALDAQPRPLRRDRRARPGRRDHATIPARAPPADWAADWSPSPPASSSRAST